VTATSTPANAYACGNASLGTLDVTDLAGKACTLFWAGQSSVLSGTLTFRIMYFLADGTTAASTPYNTKTLTMSGAWQEKADSITIPADARRVSFRAYATTTAGQTYRLAKIGLAEGTHATWVAGATLLSGPFVPDSSVRTASITPGAVGAGAMAAQAVGLLALAEDAQVAAGALVSLEDAAGVSVVKARSNVVSQTLNSSRNFVQQTSWQVAGTTVSNANDEIGPIRLDYRGLVDEWMGANHVVQGWEVPAGSLTAADIGKVWQSGTLRMTLLDVAGGTASFSMRHNADATSADKTKPTGTWTSTSGGPSIDFTPCTSGGYLQPMTVSGPLWTPGRARMLARVWTNRIVGWDTVVLAQQASVGTKVDYAALAPLAILENIWRWPGDQPGVIIVDSKVTAGSQGLTVKMWSGLQAEARSQPYRLSAFVGTTGTGMDTWAVPTSQIYAAPANWVGGQPPTCVMHQFTYGVGGGIAIGSLGCSRDRGLLTELAARTNDSGGKAYIVAVGAGNGTVGAGETVWHRGFRSTTAEPATSDRGLHIVKDPATGVVRWWLMAGSTGAATHPAAIMHAGKRLVKARGTATVDPLVTPTGCTVTGAGWAEGTVEW
jgi:hypothetical protein